jgi:hypothetical protein
MVVDIGYQAATVTQLQLRTCHHQQSLDVIVHQPSPTLANRVHMGISHPALPPVH